MSTLPRPACCSADGESYERSSITSWLQEHGAVSPRTGLPLDSTCLVPVPSLRVLIQTVLRQAASSEAGRVISIATASPSITDSSSAAASKSSAACACASAASAASFSLALARSLLPPEALHVEGGAASFGGGSRSAGARRPAACALLAAPRRPRPALLYDSSQHTPVVCGRIPFENNLQSGDRSEHARVPAHAQPPTPQRSRPAACALSPARHRTRPTA